MQDKPNHFDAAGNAVMVDVSDKETTRRVAVAQGRISMNAAAWAAINQGTAKKGDVLGTARLAGIMGAKQCGGLIPLCHPVPLEKLTVDFTLDDEHRTLTARCTAQCTAKTGVEMEALCGVNIALLTVYDMCKAMDRAMEISDVYLLEKSGGRSGHYRRGAPEC